ncbi:hypothetical protein P74p77 [Thermus phage P74-26]|uniref:Uncharacterized protein n=1 Tax=Thermus phage P74-26 TaxID=2914007 RepID=A7XXQ3_BP742|nr:hypothetical protein P74p77 [Thermus phage P74-26]ABU97027.1 hypothetical protein P74p77 [Thermus phage P74-26]
MIKAESRRDSLPRVHRYKPIITKARILKTWIFPQNDVKSARKYAIFAIQRT